MLHTNYLKLINIGLIVSEKMFFHTLVYMNLSYPGAKEYDPRVMIEIIIDNIIATYSKLLTLTLNRDDFLK